MLHGKSATPVSVSTVARCAETGGFRFVFAAAQEGEVSADLTVCWLEEKGLAYLRFITVDRVLNGTSASKRAIEAWVLAHEDTVFAAALAAQGAL